MLNLSSETSYKNGARKELPFTINYENPTTCDGEIGLFVLNLGINLIGEF